MPLPELIEDEQQLEMLLSTPTPAAVRAVAQLQGPIVVLGAGGKMGPTLARMVKRAAALAGGEAEVIAVSRFGDRSLRQALHQHDIDTVAGDLLDRSFVRKLPDAPNVIYMVGSKFGTSADAARTWAMNVLVPADICRRYRQSRILAFSTGNVYPLVAVTSGGSREDDEPAPVGEYAMTALGRERVFQYFSAEYGIPTTLVRLNYAVEVRYGVLLDLARLVYDQQPIDLAMGHVNVIWQADAAAMALAALAGARVPPYVLNVAGPELVRVCDLCEAFGRLFNRPVHFRGREAASALLSNAAAGQHAYGSPRVSVEQLVRWVAHWVERGGSTFGKPTRFEVRNGRF